eukprot:3181147-Karenia_brevis.AAC.1
MANARTMIHPDRKCTLWEDRDFNIKENNLEERTEERKRKMEADDEKIKKAKKIKADPGEPALILTVEEEEAKAAGITEGDGKTKTR